MDALPPPTNPNDLRELLTQALALEYLKARQHDTKDKKPLWLQILETTGFATLVTVLIGGLVGTGLTYLFQAKSKERELSLTMAQSQRDRELAAFNQHLDRERATVDEMSAKLGAFVEEASDLAELSREEWNRPNQKKARHDIVERFNAAQSHWHSDRVRLGVLLELEHNADPDLRASFKDISKKADAYAQCADRWRTRNTDLTATDAQSACASFRDGLDIAISIFADRLTILRARAAKGNDQETEGNCMVGEAMPGCFDASTHFATRH